MISSICSLQSPGEEGVKSSALLGFGPYTVHNGRAERDDGGTLAVRLVNPATPQGVRLPNSCCLLGVQGFRTFSLPAAAIPAQGQEQQSRPSEMAPS